MKPSAAILIDTTLCNGCEICIDACKKENGLGPDRLWPGQAKIDDLSASRYSTIDPRPGGHFVRKMCRHCLDPACVSACLVNAMQKTPEGPVIYDPSRCMGCRYCMVACPYDIPVMWEGKSSKCDGCKATVTAGGEPWCVKTCPSSALMYGPREEIKAEVHRRAEAWR